MKQEQIDRINELYHKSQSVGLTDEEKEEQAALRKQYVADIKASLRGHLNNISIVEKDGSVTDLGKKYGNVGNIRKLSSEKTYGAVESDAGRRKEDP